jgi:hypothetical protein
LNVLEQSANYFANIHLQASYLFDKRQWMKSLRSLLSSYSFFFFSFLYFQKIKINLDH